MKDQEPKKTLKEQFLANPVVQRINAPQTPFWKKTTNYTLVAGLAIGFASFIPALPDWVSDAMMWLSGISLAGSGLSKFTKAK